MTPQQIADTDLPHISASKISQRLYTLKQATKGLTLPIQEGRRASDQGFYHLRYRSYSFFLFYLIIPLSH